MQKEWRWTEGRRHNSAGGLRSKLPNRQDKDEAISIRGKLTRGGVALVVYTLVCIVYRPRQWLVCEFRTRVAVFVCAGADGGRSVDQDGR